MSCFNKLCGLWRDDGCILVKNELFSKRHFQSCDFKMSLDESKGLGHAIFTILDKVKQSQEGAKDEE